MTITVNGISGAPGVRIAIDRGGTFTDVYATVPSSTWNTVPNKNIGNAVVIPPLEPNGDYQLSLKLLSVDPQNYDDAPSEGIRRVLAIVRGPQASRAQRIDTAGVSAVRMGTTVATNALLERKGVRFGLVVTEGFKDVLEIGQQKRPDLFDLSIKNLPKMLYRLEDVVEVGERVTPEGYSYDPTGPSPSDLVTRAGQSEEPGQVVIGTNGQALRILRPLEEGPLREKLSALYQDGVRTLAVVLLHATNYPDHELRIKQIAEEIGFTHISISSSVSSTPKVVPRGHATAMDAYISPVLTEYIKSFSSHFKDGAAGDRCDFMKSDGGLSLVSKFTGVNALLSGPAGGVVGYALTAYSKTRRRPVVGFDMGGTSTDVSRYNGTLEIKHESTTAGQPVAVPQLSIETVAAGGGSRLLYKNGLFVVGPESVGAHPGPACYRKGGELAVTDANLILGRLIPSEFPSIFGPNADQPLDIEAARTKFEALTEVINRELSGSRQYTLDEVAAGFIKIANEGMSRPMQTVTQQRGYAPSAHDLCCFGGAGGQHACAIAKGLGIDTVVVPRFSSILSAYGIAKADITADAKIPFVGNLDDSSLTATLSTRAEALRETVQAELLEQGVDHRTVDLTVVLGCHYDGSDAIFDIPMSDTVKIDFIKAHAKETSFTMGRPVKVASLAVAGRGKAKGSGEEQEIDFYPELLEAKKNATTASPSSTVSAYFEYDDGGRRADVGVYKIPDLPLFAQVSGPAVLVDQTQTIVVEPSSTAILLKQHVILEVNSRIKTPPETPTANGVVDMDTSLTPDPVTLAVFSNRFMSIAEQMGVLFERTSISLSIKERLDFSCSIHNGSDGGLVVNAPHIPIHLGSMADAVRNLHEMWKGKLKPGDSLMTNHPDLGGTHLPDITVVTPFFDPDDESKVLFYMASRGHHSDIGGTGVTSMNPIARYLWEEGLAVESFKVVSNGEFEEEAVTKLFMDVANHPGCSATRRVDHNITDLRAAVSANQRGANLMGALFKEFGKQKVAFYMQHIQSMAARTVRKFLQETYDRFGGRPLEAEDYYDDGTLVKLKITIDKEEGNATFDWSGTGPQTHGNFNVPMSISYASILYCLRCMITPDIPMPLNQGVLTPITNIVPEGSILNPTGGVAVSGSTIASQRVIDIILKAFEAAAASQGCANSLGFGMGGKDAFGNVTPGWAYGEAIAGGTGAGEGWHGVHGTSCHSTNTRLTDVEVIESRLPLLVDFFDIRRQSGGRGKWNGGDGVSRQIKAREDVNVSIVSQRRVFAPFGMKGGGAGAKGMNLIYRKMDNGKVAQINLGHNGMSVLKKGDYVKIDTPAGGGWGEPVA